MRNIFSLLSKNALITGAASGLGKAIASGFSVFGATVVIADADFDEARSTALEINEKGGKALAVQVDVLSKNFISKFCRN